MHGVANMEGPETQGNARARDAEAAAADRGPAAPAGSEGKFAAAFENAGVMMLIVRAADGIVVDVNREFLKETGYTREEVVGRTSQDTGLFADPPLGEQISRGIREHGQVRELEARVVNRAGEIVYALLSSDLIILDGTPHLITTVLNTTRRHEAEEALRTSEQRYRSLIEQTADGVLLLDNDGRIMDCNPALAGLLGRPLEELRGTFWPDYVDPGQLGQTPFVRPELESGKPAVIERRMRRPDGSIVELEIHASQFARGWMMGIAHDIGARKAADRERAMLFQAIEQSADSIIITDTAGSVVYVNPAFERETGFSREEVLGRSHHTLNRTDNGPGFYASVIDAVLKDGEWSGEITSFTRHGTLLREAIMVSAVRDSSGAVVNYVAVQRNVTHERDLEDQLRQAQKMEAVGRLAGGVAHDFNNLLTAINGFAELASAEALPGTDVASYLDEIRQAAERATALTRQLLAFGRRAVLQPQSLDLNQVIAEIAPMLRRIIGDDVRLNVMGDPLLRRTQADRNQLEQVIVNLAANARDAMPGGGKLTICTENATLDESYAAEHPEVKPGAYVRMCISDTGVGMDAAIAEHIFEPFFTTKNPGSGTGLGLATVFGIVRQSDGHVSVDSTPGSGSTFCIDLPAAEESPEEASPAPDWRAVESGRETVLVVEDEPAVLAFAAQLLERSGYTVLRAENGDRAVELAHQHPGRIDLLFSDLVMPGLTGNETASAVKATRPEIRLLFASGYSEEMNASRGALAAGYPFVAKPYGMDTLLRAVREALTGD
jgi:two-component system cell cycle sensor histidine kinase/response regulator CckA